MGTMTTRYAYQKAISLISSGGGGSSTTWDNATKGAGIALSAGNLTASLSTAANGGVEGVRANASLPGAKIYYEVLVNNPIYVARLGFASALTSDLGDGTPNVGFGVGTGNFYYNSDSVDHGSNPLGASAVANDVIRIAYDNGNGRVWFALNGGNWNNNVSANPATNTSGYSAVVSGTPLYAAAFLFSDGATNNSSITARFSSASWTYAAPSGFGQT